MYIIRDDNGQIEIIPIMSQNDTSDDESNPSQMYLNPNSHARNNSGIFKNYEIYLYQSQN